MFHLKFLFQDVTLDWTFLYVNELAQSRARKERASEGRLVPRPADGLRDGAGSSATGGRGYFPNSVL